MPLSDNVAPVSLPPLQESSQIVDIIFAYDEFSVTFFSKIAKPHLQAKFLLELVHDFPSNFGSLFGYHHFPKIDDCINCPT
jgi:hypothetical protein